MTTAAVAKPIAPPAPPAPPALPASHGNNAVTLRGLAKAFRKQRGWRAMVSRQATESVRALTDVTCDVRSGEFFGLLGENGAGKTTLFKILATLVTPDAGEATVAGFDVGRSPDRVRELLAPVIADERSLHWRLSARENMRLFAALHSLRGAEATRRIDELLSLVNLTEAADRLVSGFSSGMKQRLLVARTLLARPSVLLLDEPTRSLDPISAREFRRFLREELAVRRQCAVLLATHDADEAFNLCNRVAILDKGAIVAEGTAHDLAFDVFGSQHVLTTDTPDHPVLGGLEQRSMLEILSVEREGDWSRLRLRINGGNAEASQILREIIASGMTVSSFSRETRTLADLIEGVITRGRAS